MNEMEEMKQTTLPPTQQNEEAEPLFADLTVHNIPESLFKDFGKYVVSAYPGGVSPAIQDLMKKEIEKRKAIPAE
jgi:hypothetical protein